MSENLEDPVFTEPLMSTVTQPEGFVPPMPVSGRNTPRPAPLPADFKHDVRFRGSYEGTGEITAYCHPCDDWTIRIDAGHDVTDLIRLVNQHEGLTATPVVHVDAASDLPAGSRCSRCGATDDLWRLAHPVSHALGTFCRLVLPCEQRVAARQATS